MDRVFVDTNVLLDYLAARAPFDIAAKEIMQRAENAQLELYTSTLSFCNIAYILRKLAPGTDVPAVLRKLSALVVLTPVDGAVMSDALQSTFKDFEDAVQHYSAVHFGGVTHLVTRNVADFAHSLIPVFTPEEYLQANP